MTGDLNVDAVLQLETGELGELHSPVMLVALRGWFDVSGTATHALDAISPAGEAVTIGHIDPDPFFDFTVERPYTGLDENDERFIDWPDTEIRLIRNPTHDIVVIVGVEPHLRWHLFSMSIITAAQRLGCQVVVTVGANADTVPHTRTPPVVGSTTDPELARRLGLSAPSYQGVTGLIGTLLVELDRHDIPSVSLRVVVPHYLPSMDHPKSQAALVRHLAHVLGVPFGVSFESAIEVATRKHEEAVAGDDQLQMYARMLEAEFDRRAEDSIPSSDELADQFEAYLRDQTPADPPDTDTGTAPDRPDSDLSDDPDG